MVFGFFIIGVVLAFGSIIGVIALVILKKQKLALIPGASFLVSVLVFVLCLVHLPVDASKVQASLHASGTPHAVNVLNFETWRYDPGAQAVNVFII